MGAGRSKQPFVDEESMQDYCPSPASMSVIDSLFPEDPSEVIYLTGSGFSRSELSVYVDDIIEIQWFCLYEPGYSVYQAVSDGNHLKPVPNGYTSGPAQMNGKWRQRFGHPATYTFIGTGLQASPMTIVVMPRESFKILVNETGFHPELMKICKGRTVEWYWRDPISQHSVQQVKYCSRHHGFIKTDVGNKMATLSGSFSHNFSHPGLYYFQTQGQGPGQRFLCVIHVLNTPNEHIIDVLESSFKPMLLTIEAGDRVWWSWESDAYSQAAHAVFQVQCPVVDSSADEPLVPYENGFKWITPSTSGLLTYLFEQPGIFFFSDQNYNSTASYVGVIIVLPTPRQHFFELSPETGIKPNLACVEGGDYLWWIWHPNKIEVKDYPWVMEVERCIGAEGTTILHNDCQDRCDLLTNIEKDVVGGMALQLSIPEETGVYQYRLANCATNALCASIICCPKLKNVFVTVSDEGYSPRVVTIKAGDTVWWTWKDTQVAHNIIQVSQSGNRVLGGYCSGGQLESPASAHHQFDKPGIFYYCSQSLPILFGVVQVQSQPTISPIYINELSTIPSKCWTDDIVAWIFQQPSKIDIRAVDVNDIPKYLEPSESGLTPRRVIARVFQESNVYHFTSTDFGQDPTEQEHQLMSRGSKVSSVIVDGRRDALMISLSRKGFLPSHVRILRGESVCWLWKTSEESHNIIYVEAPRSDRPLKTIEDSTSFGSGALMQNGSFLFTFFEAGEYWVASQGAPGHTCCVTVLGHELEAAPPFISGEKEDGVMHYSEIVRLITKSEAATIHYTLDGSFPELMNRSIQSYYHECGIKLTTPGFMFIRAITVEPRSLNSLEFTSKRFEVQQPKETKLFDYTPYTETQQQHAESETNTQDYQAWFHCTPNVSAFFPVSGTLTVSWQISQEGAGHLIKGYQVFLNEISYCPMLPASCLKVTCSGLAAGQTYLVKVAVYSNKSHCFPLESNSLTIVCPDVSQAGGPVISLRLCQFKDAICSVWKHLDDVEV